MFCPGCGIEEKQFNQFCRACGTDLRPARAVLEMPDIITASAETAREEIGRAFAAKIRDAATATDLKIVAEDVLPQIEKFLESPEENGSAGFAREALFHLSVWGLRSRLFLQVYLLIKTCW